MAVAYRRKVPMTKVYAKQRIAAAIKKKRMNNQPVKRSYFRKGVNKNSNYSAITTLAKQVKQLQFQRNGFKQWQHVHADVLDVYSANVPPELRSQFLKPLRDRPYSFMVNDFTPTASIFYGATQPGVSNIPSYEKAQQFKIAYPVNDLMDQFNWNIKQGQDTCLSTHYLPIKSTMRFEFRVDHMGPTDPPISVRVTLFKLKNPGIANISAALPNNLYAYKKMVTTDVRTRNYFNTSAYHTIIADKYMTFKPRDVSQLTETRVITMTYNNYSTTPLKPDITNAPTNQEIYYTVPKKDQVWALISTDNNNDDGRILCLVTKWNTWRDAAGTGS